MIANAIEPPHTIKFPTLAERSGYVQPGESMTVRQYYEAVLLPELLEETEEEGAISPRSLAEDRIALNHWERHTENRRLDQLNSEDMKALKRGMLSLGRQPDTIAKTWRELSAIVRCAVDDGFLLSIPKLKRKSRIIKTKAKVQREILNMDEAASIWRECRNATYPNDGTGILPAPKLWRVALAIFWVYGPRTLDVFNLRWSNIRFGDRLIQFETMKTSKLQGLPMTDLVEAHLRSIKTQYNPDRVFPGFKTAGHFDTKKQKWKAGYYTTWRHEITPPATLSAPVEMKNFRQRVVNDYNAKHDSIKLGTWIAGQSIPGVSALNYELPTQQIRDAINAAAVPDCFSEIG